MRRLNCLFLASAHDTSVVDFMVSVDPPDVATEDGDLLKGSAKSLPTCTVRSSSAHACKSESY